MSDLRGKLILPRLSAHPSDPKQGEAYFNTVDGKIWWYTGSAWVSATGGGGGSGTDIVFVQDAAPSGVLPPEYLWVQTNIGGPGGDFSFWIEDGS